MASGDSCNGFKISQYVLAVDVGSSSIRCHIYNRDAEIISEAVEKIRIQYPNPGWVEIEPNHLWTSFLKVTHEAMIRAKIKADAIDSMGISCQRNTYTIWNKTTGYHYHNFICWNDNRTDILCHAWNHSYQLKGIRIIGRVLYLLTRNKRFLAAAILKFTTQMVITKLLWSLQEFPEIRARVVSGESMYGTIDTWLVWKLTNGAVHATDPSNACSSGFYDPFQMKWAKWAISLFDLPSSILPEVRDTNGSFGVTDDKLFGREIPIRCVVGDQQAAVFGECCFDEGDVKATLGTGSFLDVNTGNSPHASFRGVYPLVGWRLKNSDATYLAEGGSSDTGTLVLWAKTIGLYENLEKSCKELETSDSSRGVYFIPAFSGLQAPFNDPTAVTSFIGLSPTTTKSDMFRAILESIGYRVKQLYDIMKEETEFELRDELNVDGGIANNEFVVQMISDLTGAQVIRDNHREMSSRGAAFLSGLSTGFWSGLEELRKFRHHQKVFSPRMGVRTEKLHQSFVTWDKAANRCLNWFHNKN